MVPIIEIKNLTKQYGSRVAVKNLNLSIDAGDIFGFVGPNGAGKTTTIRIMTTLLRQTSGDVLIGGNSIRDHPEEVCRLIGYMPDFFGLYNNMKVWEYLDFFAACYKIPEDNRGTLINDLLELVDMTHRRDDMVDHLSRGLQQRLCLARTLVNDPQVLILDEPASGLDPRARIEIRELLVELAKMGKTIFFSTHILADVAEICTKVGILEAGQLVVANDMDKLHQIVTPKRKVEITLLEDGEKACRQLESMAAIASVQILSDPAHKSSEDKNTYSKIDFEFNGNDLELSQILTALVREGFHVLHFSADRPNLEAVFLKATKGVVN